jgi:hypothetical protein
LQRSEKAQVTLAKAIKMVQDIIEEQYLRWQTDPGELKESEREKLVAGLVKNLEFYLKLCEQYEAKTGVSILVSGEERYEVRSLQELLGEGEATKELCSAGGRDFEGALLDALRRCQVALAEVDGAGEPGK